MEPYSIIPPYSLVIHPSSRTIVLIPKKAVHCFTKLFPSTKILNFKFTFSHQVRILFLCRLLCWHKGKNSLRSNPNISITTKKRVPEIETKNELICPWRSKWSSISLRTHLPFRIRLGGQSRHRIIVVVDFLPCRTDEGRQHDDETKCRWYYRCNVTNS